MSFLSPWFLGGLLAVGLPLYVHLLRQHKTVPMPFSSLMFFERRTQSSVKHRRLKYLALLSLRLLLILLLALLFANPFIRTGSQAAGKKLLVLAIDNSFSMRAGDRLARAKADAVAALTALRPGDRVQVIGFANTAQLLTQPVEDAQEARNAIQSLQPGDGRSSYGELARSIRALAPPSGPPVEAHVFTDVQKTSLPSPFSELAVNDRTKLTLHPVADRREANVYVERVSAPRSVYQAKKIRVQATVACACDAARETSVSIALNGKVLETRKANIPPFGRASVEFFVPEAPYGFNRGEVRVSPGDSLAQDDAMTFSLERKEPGKLLFVHGSRQAISAHFFRTALESVPDVAFTIDAVAVEQSANLDPAKYSAVVLSDAAPLPSSFDQSLRSYVRRGGSIFIALGSSASAVGKVPVLDDSIGEARYASRQGERFLNATGVDGTHPVLAQVQGFEGIKFYQVASAQFKDARVLARIADGTPLVVEKKMGQGKVLVLASTLDNVGNDLAIHPVFIPFVEQTAMHLTGLEPAPPAYTVDSHLELRSGRDGSSAVEVIAPGGDRALSLKESAAAQAYRLTREGFYEVRRGNNRNELIAVHADRRESDLDVVPKETMSLWQNAGSTGGTSGPGGASTKEGQLRLWWYFALALLIASIVESLFASRYIASPESPTLVRKQAA